MRKSRRASQYTPSSPAERFDSRFDHVNERSMSTTSREVEHHSDRRTAHLWVELGNPWDDSSDLIRFYRQPKKVHSFEDFRAADPVQRLDSSALSVLTASPSEDTFRDFALTTSYEPGRPCSDNMTTAQEMVDSEGNKFSDIDRQESVDTADCALLPEPTRLTNLSTPLTSLVGTPPMLVDGKSDTITIPSGRHSSGDSVESYHSSLRRLKTSTTSDSSSTMSSVVRWLSRVKRTKRNPRFADLEKQQKMRKASPEQPPNIFPPHISTFQPIHHKPISTQSLSVRQDQSEGPKQRDSVAVQLSPPKEKRPGFFGSRHKWSPHHSQPSQPKLSPLPSISSTPGHIEREEPFGQFFPLVYQPPRASSKPSYLSHQARLTEGDRVTPVKGLSVGTSRRTVEQESSKTPVTEKPEKDYWLKPKRPTFERFSSSSYSPCDTSDRAMKSPVFDQWKRGLEAKEKETPPLHFPRPIRPPPGLNSNVSQNYLLSEAQRVPTPTPLKHGAREEKPTAYFGDSWLPYQMENDLNHLSEFHTPYPMPNNTSITNSVGASAASGEKDWYRVRLDRIMGDDQPRDLDELRMFEWDLPEHLPNSPLCPLSPKHKSKGRAVCVYHGRQRRGATGKTPQPRRSSTDIGVDLWK